MKSQATADGITDLAKAFLESLNRKVVVLKRSVPGFLGTRLQFAMIREAFNIVQSGIADPKDVDLAAMYSFMPRFTTIGIFEHLGQRRPSVGGHRIGQPVPLPQPGGQSARHTP